MEGSASSMWIKHHTVPTEDAMSGKTRFGYVFGMAASVTLGILAISLLTMMSAGLGMVGALAIVVVALVIASVVGFMVAVVDSDVARRMDG